MNKLDLSIIIVTYKSESTIEKCINSVYTAADGLDFEIFVSDNSPDDKTIDSLKKLKTKSKLHIIKNNGNLGFSKANNVAVKKAHGKFVLFLNPDVVLQENTLKGMLSFMKEKPRAGAVTCRVNLLDGKLDDSCHRGFPTPWRAFCHFSKLSKVFPKSRIFSGYNMTYMDISKTHEVDSLAGSFMLMPYELGERLGWWDEDFFFYGEDLDFCYRIKQDGYKIYFVPDYKALHYKGVSSGIKKVSKELSTANKKTVEWATDQRFRAMRIFYDKHYRKKYPRFLTEVVLFGIGLKYSLAKMNNKINK